MALKFAIQTVFEIAAVVLIIYGFCREDRLKAKIRKEVKHHEEKD